MKKTIKTVSVLLSLTLLLCFASCTKSVDKAGLWENAAYFENTEFGIGTKIVVVDVTAGEKTVTFTIRTDKEIVGDALLEHGLIEGEEGPFGIYIKKVNGILADYDVDGSYWAFYIDGEYAMSGVDTTEIVEDAKYELVHTK